MLSRFQFIKRIPSYMAWPQNKTYATYHVESPDPLKSTHEQSQANPIIPKTNGGTFQHPNYCRNKCGIADCEHKLCDRPCNDIISSESIAHGTHNGSYPQTNYVAQTDLKGQLRPQYAKFYANPIPKESTIQPDTQKTAELNNNNEMKTNIHMNASREPRLPTNNGTNDNQNIN